MEDLPDHLQDALAGRYTIERELGRGGMATVYLAEDLKHRRVVAIKVLRPELATALGTDRFLREIHFAAQLTHPHILPLHDSGEAAGLPYYVMPYVEGETLRGRLVRERQLSIEEALRITCEVADALDYAHHRDVVHRDIKPENILFQTGHAVVADFGIARAINMAGVGRVTSTGIAVGTPGYMSPEQTGNEQLDGRSDLYSLAVVLFEMLAGELPFPGSSVHAILARQVLEPLPRLRTFRDTVPEWLEQAVARALANTPADRFTGAREFISALTKPSAVTGGASQPAAVRVQTTQPPEHSIAVLPFTNLSPDPENAFFCDGMTEEILNALSAVPSLRVASRTSSFGFKGSTEDIRAIAEKLRVRSVLEGSVRRADTKLRITAQLINAADGFHLWSHTYDREMKDVFAVQDEIARAIVNALKVNLGTEPGVLVEPHTDNLEAYALYLKARYMWRRKSAGALKKCIEYFEQAIALDPGYALAYAGVADSYVTLGYWDYLAPKEVFPQARAAAISAVEADERLGEAHTSRGCVCLLYDWDWPGAEREFVRAIELKEHYSTAHFWHACYLWAMGRTAESVEQASRAQALAPLSPVVNANLGWALYFARRHDEGIAQCEKALDLDAHAMMTYTVAGQVYAAASRFDEAITALQNAVRFSGGASFTTAALGYAYGKGGRRQEATQLLNDLQAHSTGAYVSPFCVALIHIGLGDADQALACLEQAYEDRSHWLVYAKTWPMLDDVRSAPRFTALLGKMGLS